MPALAWKQGRQASGYEKITLLAIRRPFPVDAYIIRYPSGSEIPAHIDPVSAGRHFRLNIILKPAQAGGQFKCDQAIINTSRIKLFRPDLYTHSVAKITVGSRYVLSIGWIL